MSMSVVRCGVAGKSEDDGQYRGSNVKVREQGKDLHGQEMEGRRIKTGVPEFQLNQGGEKAGVDGEHQRPTRRTGPR
jgi:hypothetical protein